MKNGIILLTTLSALLLSSGLLAKNEQTDMMTKNLIEHLKVQSEAQLKMMSDPQLLEAQAKYVRGLYDALLKQGFNKEQAMDIVVASVGSKK